MGMVYIVYGSSSLSSVHLSQLDAAEGFTISCSETYGNQKCGSSVDVIDFNGDGLSDILCGAAISSSSSQSYGFHGYLVLGQDGSNADINTSDLIANGMVVAAGSHIDDESGTSFGSSGDFNGDGYDDLVIGAPNANNSVGTTYIMLGGSVESYQNNKPLRSSETLIEIVGLSGSPNMGTFVTFVGDVNGDDFDDVLVSASNDCFLVYGSASTGTISLSDTSRCVRFTGVHSPVSSLSCNAVGDFNNDSFADLIMITEDNREAVLVFGGGSLSSVYNASNVAYPTSLSIVFPKTSDTTINQVYPAGDINGDDYDDVMVLLGSDVYVIYGNASSVSSISINALNGTRGVHVKPPASSLSYVTAACIGDINRDGYSDIIVGYPTYDNDKGITYVLYGGAAIKAWINLDDFTASDGVYVLGDKSGAMSGYGVSSAGDVNNDGYSDIMISKIFVDYVCAY